MRPEDQRPLRSVLFVPGNRPERVEKAIATGADAIIIDLEDAVPPAAKAGARRETRVKVGTFGGPNFVMVRVNGLATGLAKDDIAAVVVPGLSAVVVPKIEAPEDVWRADELILAAEAAARMEPGTVALVALLESALGVERAFEILANAPERLRCAAFGAADYTRDLGAEMTAGGDELIYPRSRVAVASRAAGREPPLDTPYMLNLRDEVGLTADALRAKRLGYQGKLCVHPAQVAPINRVFSPTTEEIARAEKILAAYREAEAKGLGAVQVDGIFIDQPIVERARRTLSLAARMEPGRSA